MITDKFIMELTPCAFMNFLWYCFVCSAFPSFSIADVNND